MLSLDSVSKFHIIVLVLIVIGSILYVNRYISREQVEEREEKVKTIHNKCGLWIRENCKGEVPYDLCKAYDKLNPEVKVNCQMVSEELKEKLYEKCDCRCLRNFSDRLPLWSINSSIDWERGGSSNIEMDENGNYIKLAETSGSGKWSSSTKDWLKEVKYAYMDTDSEVEKGEIEIKIEVSDNDFESVKDSTTKILHGGTESFGLCNLSNSEYLRITANLESKSNDKELTTLHGIWLYINETEPVDEEEVREKYPEGGS